MRNYSSPHCHLQSLDSASTPEAFAEREVELDSGSLCVTDHGSLGAVFKTYQLAKKNGLTFCGGLEGYYRDDDCPILLAHDIPRTSFIPKGSDKTKWAAEHPNGSFCEYIKYQHFTLGFRDFKAYKATVRLLSKADANSELHGQERKPLFSWNQLEELASYNTTLGSSCVIGMVSRHLLNEKIPQETRFSIAKAYFERLHYLFKDRFFVEVFPHVCNMNFIKGVFIEVEKEGIKETLKYYFDKNLKTNDGTITAEELADNYDKDKHLQLIGACNYRVWTDFDTPYKILKVEKKNDFYQNECSPWSPNGDIQFGANLLAMGLAKKYKVPILCSCDAHFCKPSQKVIQDVRLSQMGDWKFYSSYHRQSSEEAFSHFNKTHGTDLKTFEQWIDNSKQWVEGFKGFEFDNKPQLPTKFFPSLTLEYTKKLIQKHGRMPKNNPIYVERLKKEIDILHKNGKIDLLPYFFIDEEVCRVYQNQGQLTSPGRGSGAGLLLNYLLGITSVDPIKNDLSLERFINSARIESGSLPDVDQDLASRDLLVGYDTDVVEFECEDGTKHTLPKDFKIETNLGLLTAQETFEKNADIDQWWVNENQNNN